MSVEMNELRLGIHVAYGASEKGDPVVGLNIGSIVHISTQDIAVTGRPQDLVKHLWRLCISLVRQPSLADQLWIIGMVYVDSSRVPKEFCEPQGSTATSR